MIDKIYLILIMYLIKIITNIFSKYSKENINGIDVINKEIKVYPEEYFYPINYNYSRKNFTENTCMIHYYNATWAPKEEKIAIYFFRTFGIKMGKFLLNRYYKICSIKNRIIWSIKSKVYNAKMYYSIHVNYKKRVKKASDIVNNFSKYVMIYHPDWIGLSHVAKDNFKNLMPLREQYTEKEAKLMAKVISDKQIKLVIFNGFAGGWDNIAKELKRLSPEITIKVLWHGSNALLTEDYDFQVFIQILRMHETNIVDEIGFVKKSMYEFYKEKGYRCSFIMNHIKISNIDKYKTDKKNDTTKVGLYCSGDRWVKNTYNQLSAVSLIENVILDCLPLTYKVQELANQLKLSLTGVQTNLSREELFKRMAKNDINLYVTFTECAPLLPLESLELGVPCITGDNHHYFEGHEIEKYLVVNKEDNIVEIYNKIKNALENKDKIIKLYKEWKQEYNIEAKKSIKEFIKVE